jgi:hypothetical protein
MRFTKRGELRDAWHRTAYAAVIDTRAWVAARNNAEWCDLVCRGHGVTTQLDARLWVARHRSPPRYPDAVTLLPDVTVDEVLSRIDTRDGCSVKDSFAALDLRPAGFRVLFEMSGSPPPPDPPFPETWRPSRPQELRLSREAWRRRFVPSSGDHGWQSRRSRRRS